MMYMDNDDPCMTTDNPTNDSDVANKKFYVVDELYGIDELYVVTWCIWITMTHVWQQTTQPMTLMWLITNFTWLTSFMA